MDVFLWTYGCVFEGRAHGCATTAVAQVMQPPGAWGVSMWVCFIGMQVSVPVSQCRPPKDLPADRVARYSSAR